MHDGQPLESRPQRRRAPRGLATLVAGSIIASLAALPPGPATAQDAAQDDAPRLYQVEVVIFEQPSGASIERPPRAAPATAPGAGSEPPGDADPSWLDAAPEAMEATLQLPAGFAGPGAPLKLANVAARMNTGGFRLLWHHAWIQPALSGEGPELPLLATLGPGRAQAGISGTITLTAGRFLHLGFELELRTAAGLEAELRQRRRVRFNEEHYFDDPRIGVIAVVSPVGAAP